MGAKVERWKSKAGRKGPCGDGSKAFLDFAGNLRRGLVDEIHGWVMPLWLNLLRSHPNFSGRQQLPDRGRGGVDQMLNVIGKSAEA